MTGVAILKLVRPGLVALAGFRRHQTVAAMRETLVFDRCGNVLGQEAGGSIGENHDGFLHDFPKAFKAV
jgi:hypothetical protein